MALRITTPKSVRVKVGRSKARTVVVAAADVRDLFSDLGVTFDDDDLVKPGLDARVSDGDRIVLTRVRVKQVHHAHEKVAPRVVERPDSTMYVGERATVRAGTPASATSSTR